MLDKATQLRIQHAYLPPLTEDDMCGIGEHTHTALKDVPFDFFAWMVQQEIDRPLTLHRSRQWRRVIEYIRSH